MKLLWKKTALVRHPLQRQALLPTARSFGAGICTGWAWLPAFDSSRLRRLRRIPHRVVDAFAYPLQLFAPSIAHHPEILVPLIDGHKARHG